MYPQKYPHSNPIPQIIPQIQQPLPLPNAPNPPRPTQLPTQPIANTNNITGKPTSNTRTQTLHTNVITTVPIQQVQLSIDGKTYQRGETLHWRTPTRSCDVWGKCF